MRARGLRSDGLLGRGLFGRTECGQPVGRLTRCQPTGLHRSGCAFRFGLGAFGRLGLLCQPSLGGQPLGLGGGRGLFGLGACLLDMSGFGVEPCQLGAMAFQRDAGRFGQPNCLGEASLRGRALRRGEFDGPLRFGSGFLGEQGFRGEAVSIRDQRRFRQAGFLRLSLDHGEDGFVCELRSLRRGRGPLRPSACVICQTDFFSEPGPLAESSFRGVSLCLRGVSLRFGGSRGTFGVEPRCFGEPGGLGQPVLRGQPLDFSRRGGARGGEPRFFGKRVLGRPGVGD